MDNEVDVIYVDFEKAFDKVSIDVPSGKVEKMWSPRETSGLDQ